jgi:hypothetical protein
MDGKKSEGDLRQLADDITANDCRNAAILLSGKRLDGGRSTKLQRYAWRQRAISLSDRLPPPSLRLTSRTISSI